MTVPMEKLTALRAMIGEVPVNDDPKYVLAKSLGSLLSLLAITELLLSGQQTQLIKGLASVAMGSD